MTEKIFDDSDVAAATSKRVNKLSAQFACTTCIQHSAVSGFRKCTYLLICSKFDPSIQFRLDLRIFPKFYFCDICAHCNKLARCWTWLRSGSAPQPHPRPLSGPRIERAPPSAPTGLDHRLAVDHFWPISPSLTAARCVPFDARSFLRLKPSSRDESLS
jgi:hypothetical protein